MTCELTFERAGSPLPVVLKIQEALGHSVQISEVIGREHFSLDNREVNFDLVEPTSVNRRMHEGQVRIAVAETLSSLDSSVRRAVVDDPEDATGVVVGRSCHDLFNQPIERGNAILGFTAPEDSSVMHIQCRDIAPSTATKVLVLDPNGSCGRQFWVGCLRRRA